MRKFPDGLLEILQNTPHNSRSTTTKSPRVSLFAGFHFIPDTFRVDESFMLTFDEIGCNKKRIRFSFTAVFFVHVVRGFSDSVLSS